MTENDSDPSRWPRGPRRNLWTIAMMSSWLGCATAPQQNFDAIEPDPDDGFQSVRDQGGVVFQVHLGATWWPFRGATLGLTPEDAKSRDDKISDRAPPAKFWDKQVATEAAAVWGGLCNDCHGGRRKVSEANLIPPPEEGWPRGLAYFFGRERERATVFRTIYNGGEAKNGAPSEMPAWGTRLSREQIWALVYYIEYQSGGVEGAFPPGLYPKRSDELEEPGAQ